jgi:hypothetical protein
MLFVISFLLVGCRIDPNNTYIQGNWYFIHQRNKPIYHNPGEDIEYWTFTNGTYHTRSCCIHLNDESGVYDIVASDEGSITLNLLPKGGGQFSDDYQLYIKINREDKTIKINNQGPYYPGYPK